MSTYVLKDALERAGSTNRKKLRDALPKQSYDKNILPYDCIRFDQTGQSPEAQLIIMQIIDGKHKTVCMFESASADPTGLFQPERAVG